MLRRNKKRNDSASSETGQAHPSPSPVFAPYRTNTPPIKDGQSSGGSVGRAGVVGTGAGHERGSESLISSSLPSSFPPHAKSLTAGSNQGGGGHRQGEEVRPAFYQQGSPPNSSSSNLASSSTARGAPRYQSFNSMQHSQQPNAHSYAPQQQHRQHPRSIDQENVMPPPPPSMAPGRLVQQPWQSHPLHTGFPASQSVEGLGVATERTQQAQTAQTSQPTPQSTVGRSQSTFNFLLSKAKAPFSSGSSTSSATPSTYAHPMSNPALNASASLSSLYSSNANGALEDKQHASRNEPAKMRNRTASESSNSLFQGASSADYAPSRADLLSSNGRTSNLPSSRPSIGDDLTTASSPTKRGFFGRERKASSTSINKPDRGTIFGNAARQAFSHSPLGRNNPGQRNEPSSSASIQFTKSQTDLTSRPDFPSPASVTIELPRSPQMTSFVVSGRGAASESLSTGDSTLLRSLHPHAGFSRSVDDLARSRTPPPPISPSALSNPGIDAGGNANWGEHGVAAADWGRASDMGALKPDARRVDRAGHAGVGANNVPLSTANSISSSSSSSWSGAGWGSSNATETSTFDSLRHQRKSSRPLANVRDVPISSPKQAFERPALGAGVAYEGFLNRNANVSLSIHQLSGKDKEKEIAKGWKPYKVTLKEGKMYFCKPSSSLVEEVRLLFPTSVVIPSKAGEGSSASTSYQGSLHPSSSNTSLGLSVEDVKRSKLGTRDLLTATSSQTLDPRAVPRRGAKDSRLSAIMDSTEPDLVDAGPPEEPLSETMNWELPNRHGDLVLRASKEEPSTWAARLQGGSADALAHEFVYATQCSSLPSIEDSAATLALILSVLRQSSTSPLGFLSSLRKWARSALEGAKEDGEEAKKASNRAVLQRLIQVTESDIVLTSDEQSKASIAQALDAIRREFNLTKVEGSNPSSSSFTQRTTVGTTSNQLTVPQQSSAPSEKDSRRMTAFFRGAVRPIGGLMTSTSGSLSGDSQPRSFNELLAMVTGQKPSLVVQCGASRVSVWNNAQRSFVFNLSPPDGGHILLQAHSEHELQEWCRAIEQSSKEFAHLLSPTLDLPKKGINTSSSSPLLRSAKATTSGLCIYGTDIKLLAEIEQQSVPTALSRMLEEIEKRGLREQGLYRISGAKSAIEGLKMAFSTQPAESVNLTSGEFSDVHTIAGAIKQWFRDLPEPVIPFGSYHTLIQAERIESEEERLYAFRDIIWDFPRVHFELLKRISEHLSLVCDEGQYNLMAPHNIGLVFGTSLLNPPPGPASVAESFGNIGKAAHIVKIIVTMNEWLFEPEPLPEAISSPEEEVREVSEEAPIAPSKSQPGHLDDDSDDKDVRREAEEREVLGDEMIQEESKPAEESLPEKAPIDSHAELDLQSLDSQQEEVLEHEYVEESAIHDDMKEERLSNDRSYPSEVGLDGQVPWLDNPLLTVDEGTIDSHASESSMMRAVLGAHPSSSFSNNKHTLAEPQTQAQSQSQSFDSSTAGQERSANESGTCDEPPAAISSASSSSNREERPNISRANSAQQIFLDVSDELPPTTTTSSLASDRQKMNNGVPGSESSRNVESVYLDATDAMAILHTPSVVGDETDDTQRGAANTTLHSAMDERRIEKEAGEEEEEAKEELAYTSSLPPNKGTTESERRFNDALSPSSELVASIPGTKASSTLSEEEEERTRDRRLDTSNLA